MKILVFAVLMACAAAAQTMTEPPPLVRLHRRPGVASVRPYADLHVALDVLGMTSLTGPLETWLMEIHDSFAGIEDVDKILRPAGPFGPGDIQESARSWIGVYRPGFSYRPEQAIQALRQARYCQVSIYQVRPGSEAAFGELVKSRRIEFDTINLDKPDLAYYVFSGAAAGTYLFLAPLTSLKTLDDGLAKLSAENLAAEPAKFSGITREYLLLRVDPANSWVSDDFASADAEYWHGKPATP